MLGALCCFVGLWYAGHAVHGGGTNNVQHPELLTPAEIKRRGEASKTAVVGRFCYVTAYVIPRS